MAIFFRKITLVTEYSSQKCMRILKSRSKRSSGTQIHNTTHSVFFNSYFVTTLSWWDWHNSFSEPKFIGKLKPIPGGTNISGIYIPGFGSIFLPILLPIALLALTGWMLSVWLQPISTNTDRTTYYATLTFITLMFMLIAAAFTWIFLHDRWESDALILKISRILDAKIVN